MAVIRRPNRSLRLLTPNRVFQVHLLAIAGGKETKPSAGISRRNS